MELMQDGSWMGQQRWAAGGALQPGSCGSISSNRFSQDLKQLQHMQKELAELTALLDMQAGPISSSSSRVPNHYQQQQHEIEALTTAAAADVDPPSFGCAGSGNAAAAAAAAAAGSCIMSFHGVAAPSAATSGPGLEPDSLPSSPSAAAVQAKMEPAAALCTAAGSSDVAAMDQTVDEVCHFLYDDHMAREQQQHEQQQEMIAESTTWTTQNIASAHMVQQQLQVIKQQQQLRKLSRQQRNNVDLLQKQQKQQIGSLVQQTLQQDVREAQPAEASDLATQLVKEAQSDNSLPTPGQLLQTPISNNNSTSSSSSSQLLLIENSSNLSLEASIMQSEAADTLHHDGSIAPPLLPSSLSSSISHPAAVANVDPLAVLPSPAAAPAAATTQDHLSLPPPRKRPRRQQNKSTERQCANCKTVTSSYWRTDLQVPNRKLCNACGLYKAKHRVDRPRTLWPVEVWGLKKRLSPIKQHSANSVMQALRAYVSTPGTPPRPRGGGAPTPSYMQTAVPVTAVPVVVVQPVQVLAEELGIPQQQQQQQCLRPAEFVAAGQPWVAPAALMDTSCSSTAEAVRIQPVSSALTAVPAVFGPAITAETAMHNSSPGYLPQHMPTGGVAGEGQPNLLEHGQRNSAETSVQSDSDGQILDSEGAADGSAATGKDGCAATEAAAGVQQFLQKWVTQNAA